MEKNEEFFFFFLGFSQAVSNLIFFKNKFLGI